LQAGSAGADQQWREDQVQPIEAAGGDPAKLVTQMRFDTKAPVPKLFFKPVRWLDADEIDTCIAQGATPEAERAVQMTVSQQDGVPAASTPAPLAIGPAPTAPKSAKPKPAPAPARAAEPEEGAEPEVRQKPAAANAVPPASKLAATLSDWDDE
jgi:hypothetical protein